MSVRSGKRAQESVLRRSARAAGFWIQHEFSWVSLGEVEHVVDGIGDGVERALADPLAVEPVVFDEAQDGGLVGQGMIHVVVFCPRRDYQQRDPRAKAAAALRVQRALRDAW